MEGTRATHSRLRGILVFGCAVMLVAPLGGAGPAVAAVEAAKPAPAVTVMPGNRQAALSWTAIKGAKKYRVEVSTSRKFPKKGTSARVTKATTAVVTKLADKKNYFVRVTPQGAGRVSKTSKVVPVTHSPALQHSAVQLIGLGGERMRLQWNRLKAVSSITVQVGATSDLVDKPTKEPKISFSVPVKDLTARFVDFTIPAAVVPVIGSASGNWIFARLTVVNAKSSNTVKLSGMAKPLPPGPGASVRFATYNVKSIPSSQNMPGNTWEDRRERVVNAIAYSEADIVAVQEATTYRATPNYPRHFEELARYLGRVGYELAYPFEAIGSAADQDINYSCQLFFRTKTIERLAGGPESTRDKRPAGSVWPAKNDRQFAWGKFRVASSGAEFYAASLHLQTGNSAADNLTRDYQIGIINSFMTGMAGTKPVVVMGDFNSNPLGVGAKSQQSMLVSWGWASAAATTNAKVLWASTNTQGTGDNGFPTVPFKPVAGQGSRIDGIFTRNIAGSKAFEVQVVLNADGTFDRTYQGSDHNLLKADLPIR